MRIKNIHINNYRSFSDSKNQPITKLFALIGKNNSGKSAFISAIQCVLGGKKLQETDVHKKNGGPINIKLVVEETKDDIENPVEKVIECEFCKGELKFRVDGKESKKAPADLPKLLVIPAIRNPQKETTAADGSFLNDLLSTIVDLKAKETPKLESFKKKEAQNLTLEEIKSLFISKTSDQLGEIGVVISNYFQESIEDEKKFIKILTDGDPSKAIKYSTKLKEPDLGGMDEGVDILNCGTGLQSMVIMALLQTYADLQKQEDSILLIEEPEVYLHPDLQRKMFSVLRKIAKRTQVIYTTHSPIMISDLRGNSVRLIKRQLGESIISEIDIQGVIQELGIRYEDVLNPKVVIFVEGPTDILFYKRIMELKYPAIAQNLNMHIKFIDTGGFDSIHAYALMHILLSLNVETNFYILADSDGKDKESRKTEILKKMLDKVKDSTSIDKEKLKKVPKLIRTLSKYAIESYLLDYPIVAKLDNRISKQEFDSFLKHYEECFDVLVKKGSQRRFRTYKPKLLFEDPEPKQLELLFTDFKNEPTFKKVRDQIVKAWTSKKISNTLPITCIIDEDTINNEILKEPISFLDEIIRNVGITTT